MQFQEYQDDGYQFRAEGFRRGELLQRQVRNVPRSREGHKGRFLGRRHGKGRDAGAGSIHQQQGYAAAVAQGRR